MRVKTLLYGIFLILLIGLGGFVYRNALERSHEPIACPLDARVCPDGTALGRTGLACEFPACPPPNVTLTEIGMSYAVPPGFTPISAGEGAALARYVSARATTTPAAELVISRYAIASSSTALATIQVTALGASGEPTPATAYSSTMIGTRRFTVVTIERSLGVVHTAFYLSRGTDVLRFDAIDREVPDATSPGLITSSLPAHTALRSLLAGLEGG